MVKKKICVGNEISVQLQIAIAPDPNPELTP